MKITEISKSSAIFIKKLFGAVVTSVVYIFLVVVPFLYFLKNLEDPATFMMDFGILTFTVGMFSFIVYERNEEKFRDFYTSGFLFLFSGALTMNSMFMTPFMQNLDLSNSYSILPTLLDQGLSQFVEILTILIFVASLFLASFSFGIGTLLILQSTYKEGIQQLKDSYRETYGGLKKKFSFL